MSAILPMLHLFETKLLKDEAGDTHLTKDIRRLIKQDLSSRYTIPKITAMVLKILKMVTFLDPRFKCHFSDDADVEDIKETLHEEGAKIIQRALSLSLQQWKIRQALLLLQVLHPPRRVALVPFSRMLLKKLNQFYHQSSKSKQ